MGQTHVLAGLSTGTKEERDALLEQLLSIDFGILQQALEEGIASSNSLVRWVRGQGSSGSVIAIAAWLILFVNQIALYASRFLYATSPILNLTFPGGKKFFVKYIWM